MKNLLKNINAFGLGLILICGVVLTTQSAFTNDTDVNWYFDGTNWILESQIPLEPGQVITCDGDENNCRALFTQDADPNNPDGPEDSPANLGDQDFGTFDVVTP